MEIKIDRQAQSVTFSCADKVEYQYGRGDIIGESYKLIDLIGQGGMGVVYRAKHLALDKQFALKLLAPDQVNQQNWRRFETEGRALAKLNHANIVSIYNMGISRGCPYFVMDWIEGISLAERIELSGPLNDRIALNIFQQISNGLGCAHKHGIIHRDIKPANIMLIETSEGTKVKIVDFGIARLQTAEASGQQALTAHGEVFGSPLYMSPEQTRGEKLDARSDLYSLGCSLFETLTGQVPFRGNSALATSLMHQEAEIPKLSSKLSTKTFNPTLDLLVGRCLHKDVNKRYQSADQVAVDIERILAGKPIGTIVSKNLNSNSNVIEEEPTATEEHFYAPKVTQKIQEGGSKKVALISIFAAIPLVALLAFTISNNLKKTSQQEQAEHRANAIERQLNSATSAKGLSPLRDALGTKGKSKIALSSKVLKTLTTSPKISMGKKSIAGKSMRCFNFPTVVSIGEIEGAGLPRLDALGEVQIPSEADVYLRLNSIVSQCPSIIDKIAVADITSLRLDDLKPAQPVLERLAKWTNLRTLAIDNDLLSDADLASLDKQKRLSSLSLKTYTLNWKLLTRLKLLYSLNSLQLSNCEQINNILENLPVLPNLKTVELSGQADQWLSKSGIGALAKQPNLKTLKIKKRKPVDTLVFSSSTILSPGQDKMNELPLTDWVYTFSQLKSLEKLEIEKPLGSDEEIQNFLRQIPAARVNDWASKFENS